MGTEAKNDRSAGGGLAAESFVPFRALLPVACSASHATKLPSLESGSVDHHMGDAAAGTGRSAGRLVGRCVVPIYYDSCCLRTSVHRWSRKKCVVSRA